MAIQIQLRRDTSANWTSVNPTLASGELGIETDTNKLKVGNGATAWSSLSYSLGSSTTVVNDLTTGGSTSALSAQQGVVLNGLISGKQPLDATLTAFAGQTIAADSITVGTGPDAFVQVALGAGTFLAKSSAGAAAAKPITDFALTILDDTNAANARTTLGAAASASPTFSGPVTHPGPDIVVGVAVAGDVINFAVGQNDYTFSSSPTCTFTGSPVTGQSTTVKLIGYATAAVLTLPANVRSVQQQAVVASITIPINYIGYMQLVKTTAGYDMIGEPISLKRLGLSRTQSVGANTTKTLSVAMPHSGVLNAIFAKTSSGTINVQVRIGGVNATGGSVTAASTRATSNITAFGVFAKDAVIDIVYSGNSSAADTDVTVQYTPDFL